MLCLFSGGVGSKIQHFCLWTSGKRQAEIGILPRYPIESREGNLLGYYGVEGLLMALLKALLRMSKGLG
jgi:hypothetical protein